MPPVTPNFSRFHSVKRRHRGRHCGSNPLQSRGNGTNNLSSDSPATISSTITEILFLLRQKCPTANGYLFPILPQFDQLKTHFATTNYFIYFKVQEFFFRIFFSHELPSTLYNQNLYRADKLHLTTKGNEILVRWFNHCLTISTSTMQRRTKPTRMPSSLQDVPPTFVIIDTDCTPLPAPSQLTNPTFLPPCRYSKQSLTPPCTCTSNSPKSGLIPF